MSLLKGRIILEQISCTEVLHFKDIFITLQSNNSFTDYSSFLLLFSPEFWVSLALTLQGYGANMVIWHSDLNFTIYQMIMYYWHKNKNKPNFSILSTFNLKRPIIFYLLTIIRGHKKKSAGIKNTKDDEYLIIVSIVTHSLFILVGDLTFINFSWKIEITFSSSRNKERFSISEIQALTSDQDVGSAYPGDTAANS